MSISWRDELAIGNSQIDQQHRELLERFDLLLTACRRGEGRTELSRLLDFLDEYVVKHFGDEEQLQRESGYPEFQSHQLLHLGFTKRLVELKRTIKSEGEVQVDHVLTTNKMLLDWLVQHISTRDRELGQFLREKGLS
ncbi:MAG: hemerythrin family protein [Trichlorobacter sp.]|jgi:hemerythrin